MLVKGFGWKGLALSLLLALGVWAYSGKAIAQVPYSGDYWCSNCHSTEYGEYQKHGHPWMEVHTGGQTPASNLFANIGEPVPPLPPAAGSWANVEDIVGNFEGQGSVLLSNGTLCEQSGGKLLMPEDCNNCHNPCGFDPTGHAYSTTGSTTGIQGSWDLNGVQCEWCHGPGNTMSLSTTNGEVFGQICRDCHSTGDFNGPNGANLFRIPFDPATAQFTNHHMEGDEYRRSPHQNDGCTGCHDPHKSVWHEQGGVNFAADPTNPTDVGNSCMGCHETASPPAGAPQVRLRGTMGQIGILCVDCHMPEISGASAGKPHSGTRRTHIFKINPNAPAAADPSNWTQQLVSSSGTATKIYWNPTDPAGQAFLTLDMVCTQCHSNMTLAQMSSAAQTIHRQGAADVTVNGQDGLQTIAKGGSVTVSVSLIAGAEAGVSSNVYVVQQGPKGYSSYVTGKWVTGLKPWYSKWPQADIPPTTVLTTTTLAGAYTYWMAVQGSDGTQSLADVPVFVKTK